MDEVLNTLRLFPKQCQQAWHETQQIKFSNFTKVSDITVCSMGGSSFGWQAVKSLFENDIKVPLLLFSDYKLPAYISQKSLLILSSYSGTTEEVISCLNSGIKINTQITAITKPNSPLGDLLKSLKLPYYQLDPKYNPANQPRVAFGYMVIGLLGILSKTGFLDIKTEVIDNAIKHIEEKSMEIENQARIFVQKLKNYEIIIIAGEHLAGNAHIIRNQFNETAKNLAFYNLLPELNHHFMEGLSHPDSIKNKIKILLFNSSLYSDKIKKRVNLTTEVIEKNKIDVESVDCQGETKLEQVLWTMLFGGFVSYFLSIENKENAQIVPWVDYFKKRLNE